MQYSFGWQRDLPDVRDYTLETEEVDQILMASAPLQAAKGGSVNGKVDLREWCSPVEDQQDIGSCTAHAGVGLFEYYHRRVYGKHLNLSRLFLYKVTRKLLGWTGDTGAYLRSTMQAMAMFGAPPERHYPYETTDYDDEPDPFHYAMAQNFQAMRYFRLDSAGIRDRMLLEHIKWMLSAGLPCMFGFTVYSSLSNDAWIPYPTKNDSVQGGHAVVAIGYDDNMGDGALMIRNSWGDGWGHDGYGWLPYDYVLKGLATDFWSMAEAEFVDSDLFV